MVEQQSASRSWDPAYERRAVALLAVGFGLVGLDRWIIAPLFPVMMQDLGLSYQDLGTITAVLAITWGIFSIITGGLSDRIGRRKVFIPAIIAFSVLAGFTGLAGGLGALLVIRAIMGVFEGAFTPTSIAATSEASKPSRRGFNMGVQQSLFALLGLGFGPIVATQLLVVVPSWHWVFVIVALPGLVARTCCTGSSGSRRTPTAPPRRARTGWSGGRGARSSFTATSFWGRSPSSASSRASS